jgi:hypothetical protein
VTRPAVLVSVLLLAVGFAAGFAASQFLGFAEGSRQESALKDRGTGSLPASAAPETGIGLAARPGPATYEADGPAGPADASAPAVEPAPVDARMELASAREALRMWESLVGPLEEEHGVAGDQAAARLEVLARPGDRESGLLLAKWMAKRGGSEEATRRVKESIRGRMPTQEEIAWLVEVDPIAAVEAAKALVARSPGSPHALHVLAEAQVAAGDLKGAFDTYVAALRAGLDSSEGASALARLDPERAIPILAELYGGKESDPGSTALIEAYLRTGRVAEARHELLRIVPRQLGGSDILDAAAILDPQGMIRVLASRMEDLEAAASNDGWTLLSYSAALRRAGRGAEAMRAAQAVAESQYTELAWIEMMRGDPFAARAFVETRLLNAHFAGNVARVTLLGLLGRRAEALVTFETLGTGGRDKYPRDAWVALAHAAPERAIAAIRREAEEADEGSRVAWNVALARALEAAGRLEDARAAWAGIPPRELDLVDLATQVAVR